MTSQTIRFASWGRVSTEDRQDPESSRAWQRARSTALIEPRGGQIVTEFFDIDKSRSITPQRHPEAARLLVALADPNRGFDAVVVGAPQRAFYGNQFGNTFPLFAHYGVPLWVPEAGGPIDPDNEAHDLIMSVFGGVSKGERNRIRVRVRTAMATQAQIEGRYLGGRPPYGYTLIDVGPHPNPAKAADGKKLHALAIDEPAAAAVRRIFGEFLSGHGLYAIAEHLTRDGIACPSAHDPARNPHRCGVAWSKSAIRAILTNPRYTGRQVWNKQRKDEVLIDVTDIALGHTTKQRWNDHDRWIFSDNLVHPPIIDAETFAEAQQLLAGRAQVSGPRERFRRHHVYVLGGRFICGLCDRKMQAHWSNDMAYYRCRFPAEYALANNLTHPRDVFVRERDVVPELDDWLRREFEPHRLAETIDSLAAASTDITGQQQAIAEAQDMIRACDAKMARYQEAIDAGADIIEVTKWINATKADRLAAQAAVRGTASPARMTRDEIDTIIRRFASLAAVIRDADPADKAEIYQGINLVLTYQPKVRLVRAEIAIERDHHGVMGRVRGGFGTNCLCWCTFCRLRPGRRSMSAPSDRWIRRTTVACVALLALIAGTVSYLHMHALVALYGQPGWVAALTPFSVDGMIVAASTTLLADSRSGRNGGALPWVLLVVGSLASLAANVAVAEPTLIGRIIAAWPSFALTASYELLTRQVRRTAWCPDQENDKLRPVRPTATIPRAPIVRTSSVPPVCAPHSVTAGNELKRQAWQWALDRKATDGALPSGKAIGGAYGRHERWGRLVKGAGLTGAFDTLQELQVVGGGVSKVGLESKDQQLTT